jgi:ribose/xylose/arabinose/galactoside ABC-type transport system permease subunit
MAQEVMMTRSVAVAQDSMMTGIVAVAMIVMIAGIEVDVSFKSFVDRILMLAMRGSRGYLRLWKWMEASVC